MNACFPRALLFGLPLLGVPSLAAPLTLPAQEGPVRPGTPAPAVDPAEIVARVGRIDITRADLAGEYERLIPWNYFHGKVPDEKKHELKIQARDTLIEKALIHQDAQDRSIEVSEEAIRARLTETLKKAGPEYAGVTPEQFERLLEQYGPAVRRRILIERNEERFEKSLEPVTEEALRARYEEVKDELLSTERASFLMIQLDVDPAQRGALMPLATLRANELRTKLTAGASFEELAKEHSGAPSASKGGALGFVTERGFPIAELGPAAFSLADGETSLPLESIYGVHLLRRLESQPRRKLEFDEARPQLTAELEHVQRSIARKAWFEEMRKRYPVQILVDLEQRP